MTCISAAIAVALGAIPVLGFIHGFVTGRTRKAAKVPYPHSYASVEECKANVGSRASLSSQSGGPMLIESFCHIAQG